MYKFIFNARECISCAICVDVCGSNSLSMRTYKGKKIEGYLHIDSNGFDNDSTENNFKLSFPFFSDPTTCDGCLECVKECPVSAIEIEKDNIGEAKGTQPVSDLY